METSEQAKNFQEKLDAKIPRDVISQRDGGGRKLSYLEGWYVINRLNEIFGQGNWAYVTEEMRLVYTGEVEGARGSSHVAHYIAKIALIVHAYKTPSGQPLVFSDYGYGDGSDKANPGKAHELASKEAVTDGIKRCAKSLGMSLGLALYDKTQENVDDGEEDAKPAPRAVAQSAAPDTARPATKAAPVAAAPGPKSAAPGNGAVPEAPPADREQLNKMIKEMSGVIVAKKTKTLKELLAEMTSRFGTDKKESLSDEQAAELYTYLRGIL